jgi:uncharacterized membrane protein YhaH (DUF805 family)
LAFSLSRISRKEFWLGYLGLLAACGLLSQALLYVAIRFKAAICRQTSVTL